MSKVIKRNGTEESFNIDKIIKAVSKAYNSCGLKISEDIIAIINHTFLDPEPIYSVEMIQDMVEEILMSKAPASVAKAYIIYRNRHALLREVNRNATFKSIIDTSKNDITRDNANMNADTPAGMMMKFASETTKPYVNAELLSLVIKEAVENNYLYIHDKDYYPTKSLTCIQHPLNKILQEGFICGHGEARPAKRIETAAALAEVSLQAVQNEMHK